MGQLSIEQRKKPKKIYKLQNGKFEFTSLFGPQNPHGFGPDLKSILVSLFLWIPPQKSVTFLWFFFSTRSFRGGGGWCEKHQLIDNQNTPRLVEMFKGKTRRFAEKHGV